MKTRRAIKIYPKMSAEKRELNIRLLTELVWHEKGLNRKIGVLKMPIHDILKP